MLYVFADQLDDDPWLLLAWRGRTRDQLLDPMRTRAGGVAPRAGRRSRRGGHSATARACPRVLRTSHDGALGEAPDPPDGVLRRLATLDVDVRGATGLRSPRRRVRDRVRTADTRGRVSLVVR